jgi:hypothetical protein
VPRIVYRRNQDEFGRSSRKKNIQEMDQESWSYKLRTSERQQAGQECLSAKRYGQSQQNQEEPYSKHERKEPEEIVCQELSAALKEDLWIRDLKVLCQQNK